MTFAVNIAQGGSNNTTMRNRIINGAMVIDQRNAGAAVTTSGSFPVDRFNIGNSGTTATFSMQQSSTAPAGFVNSVAFTVTASDATLDALDRTYLTQSIEGLNVADLGWGTANAATVTLSFWVRSSLTGTFGGSLRNSAGNRSYPFTYTISSANTFEQKTVTIVGDTSGTWLTTNGIGIQLHFSLGVGATLSGTAGSWAGANYLSATGAVSLTQTSGATFYITGVQLEAGTTASPFEYRLYGTELALCQRYFEKSYDIGTVSGTSTIISIANAGNAGQSDGAANGCLLGFKVTKRAAPTMAYFDGAGTATRFTTRSGGVTVNGRTLSAVNSGENSALIDAVTSVQASMLVHFTASAEL
jgi:hypothetical protein